MRKQNRRANRGFTLPEMLVVICLTALLLSFFLQCFFQISNQHKQRSALLELQDNLLLAEELLMKDIEKSTAVLACDPETLALQQAIPIYYSLGTDQQADEHFYDLQGNIFYRRTQEQGKRQPMANFIDEMTISYLDQYGQPTTVPKEVRAVHVLLTGSWNDRQLRREQVIRLAGAMYL